MLERRELVEIASELMKILNSKQVSPDEAKTVAYIFQQNVEGSIEKGTKEYLKNGIFEGSSPETRRASID